MGKGNMAQKLSLYIIITYVFGLLAFSLLYSIIMSKINTRLVREVVNKGMWEKGSRFFVQTFHGNGISMAEEICPAFRSRFLALQFLAEQE